MYARTGKTGLEAYNFNCFDFLTSINPQYFLHVSPYKQSVD